MANPDVLITPGDGKIEFSGSSAGDSNSSKIRVGSNGDLHVEGSDLFVSGDLTVSGDITSSSASQEATSYTASTHFSGLSGYFGKLGVGASINNNNNAVLDVQGAGTATLNVRNQAASSNSTIHLGEQNTSLYGVELKYEGNLGNAFLDNKYNHSTRPHIYFRMKTAGTPVNAMAIAPNGYLGVGDFSNGDAQAMLQVSGDTSITGELRTAASAAIGGTTPNKGSWTNALTIEGSSSSALELTKGNTLYGFFGVQGAGSSHQLDVAAYQNQNIRLRVGSNAATTAMLIRNNGTIEIAGAGVVEGNNSRADVVLPDGSGIAIGSAFTFANIYGLGGDLHLRANSYPANLGEASSIYLSTSTSAGGQAGDVVVSGGHVGIGTEKPNAFDWNASAKVLEVFQNDSNGSILKLRSNSTNTVFAAGNAHLQFGNISSHPIKFYTAGSQKMVLQAAGQVGIGTSTPDSLLHINTSSTSAGTDNFALKLQNPNTAADARVGIAFATNAEVSSNFDGAVIQATNNGVDGKAHIMFGAVEDNSFTENIRFRSDGKVGIGTTDPTTSLHINGALMVSGTANSTGIKVVGNEDLGIIIVGNDESHPTQSLAGARIIGPDSRRLYFELLGNDVTDHFRFLTSPNNDKAADYVALHIGNNGNIGIGTDDPISLLTVSGDTTNGQFLTTIANAGTQSEDNGLFINVGTAGNSANAVKVTTGGRSNAFIINGEGKAGLGLTASNMDAIFTVNGDVSITGETRIAGDVGIGAVPVQDLHVGGNGGVTSVDSHGRGFRVQDMNHAHGAIDIVQAGDQAQFISRSNVQGDFAFKSYASASTSLVERMRIDVDGKVGIGMNGLNGSFTPSGLLHIKGTNTAKIILENTDNATNIDIDYFNNGDAVQSRIRYSEGPGSFTFSPNVSSSSSFTTMLFNGNVGIGTADPDEKLHISGNAIIANAHTSNTTVRIGGGLGTSANYGAGFYTQEGAVRNTLLIGSNNGGSCIRMTSQNSSSYEIWADSTALHFDSMNANRDFYFNSNTSAENIVYITQGEGAVGIGVNPTALRGSRFAVSGDASITGKLTVASTVSSNSSNDLELQRAGTTRITLGGSSVTVNDNGENIDFRVEGDNEDNLIRTDAANDRVGIATSNPGDTLHIHDGHLLFTRGVELRSKDTGGSVKTIARVNGSNELEYGWSSNGPVKFMGGGSYTERMRIHTNGNIGIGTNSPASRLHLYSASDSNTILKLQGGSDTNKGAHINFLRGTTDIGSFGTKATLIGGTSNDLMFFSASNDFIYYSTAERMRIKANGNVGIGTNSPGSLLEVYEDDSNAGNTQIHIHNDKTDDAAALKLEGKRSSANDFAQVIFANNGNNGAVIQGRRVSSNDDGALAFFTSAPGTASVVTEAMRINNTGQVGIGTTDPDQVLHIKKSLGTTTVLTEVAANSTIGFEIKKTAGTVQHWKIVDGQTVNGRLEFYDATDDATRMIIDGDGDVGIGTIAPVAALHVHGNSDNGDEDCQLVISDADTSAGSKLPSILFRSLNDAGSAYVNTNRIRGTKGFGMQFATETSSEGTLGTVMTLDNSQHVGIGVTTPQATLQVNGDVGITGELRVDADIRVPGNRVNIGTADTTSARCNILGAGSNSNTTSLRVFRQGGAESFRVYDGGQVTVGANATPTATFQVNGDASITGQLSTESLHVHDSNGSAANRFKIEYNGTNGNATVGPDSGGGNTNFLLGTSNAGSYSTKVAIKNDGKVGIGTGSPSTEGLEIVAPSADTTFTQSSTADSILVLRNSDSGSTNTGRFCALQMKINSSSAAASSTIRTQFVGNGDARLIFSTTDGGTSADRVHIDSDGSLYIDNIADFGSTASASTKFLVSDSGYVEFLDGDEIIYDITVTFSNSSPSAGASTTVSVSVNGKGSNGGSPTLTLPSS
mgnify:CR=1 FL=1